MSSAALSDRLPLQFLYVAMFGALLGAVADVLLLYNPAGGYEAGDYLFLQDLGSTRLLWGHYIGIFAIPLEALGLWFLYEGIKPAGQKIALAVLVIGIYVMFPGVAYHGTVIFSAHLLQLKEGLPPEGVAQIDQLFPTWKLFFEPLGFILFIGFAVISLLFAWVVATKPTHFARWLAWANPFTFYLLFVLFYVAIPPIGTVLIPAGFNLAFFLFFLCARVARE